MGALHVLGNVFAVAGPLSAGHVEVHGLAARGERLRHVALHRAIQTDRAETIVRVHMAVIADLGQSGALCRGDRATAVLGIQGDVARAFRREATGLVGEDVADVIRQTESRRIWIITLAGQMQLLLLPVNCRRSRALHLEECYN